MDKRVTIKDIAVDVGVSISVVSYVLNDSKDVSISEQTKRKVLEAANRLGYVQNKNAAILRSGKSYTIGVVSYWQGSYVYEYLIDGIKEAATKEGYKILIYNASINTDIEDFISYYNDHMIDGIVIIAPYNKFEKYDIVRYIDIMERQGIKFSVINENLADTASRVVSIDYDKCIYTAVNYFVEKGYTEIAYVTNLEKNDISTKERYKAYTDIMQKHNLKPIICDLKDIEKQIHNFKSVVTDKTNSAYHVLTAAIKLGCKVPDDFEIIASNTEYYSKYLYPPLTTVKVPAREIGGFAVQNVINQIKGLNFSNSILPNYEYEIVFRESTKK